MDRRKGYRPLNNYRAYPSGSKKHKKTSEANMREVAATS